MIPRHIPESARAIGIKDTDLFLLNILIDEILDNQREDFEINPSAKHTYYLAVALREGLDKATDLLREQFLENKGL